MKLETRNQKSEVRGQRFSVIYQLISVICLLSSLTPAYSYSLFSAAGLGEPIEMWSAQARGMGGVYYFKFPKDLSLEFSLLFENVDADGKARNFDFTLPSSRFSLPLPLSTAIDVKLNELLNLNFELQDEWQEFAGDSVQHRVKSRGSASIGKIGIYKTIAPLSVEAGGFIVFGSSMEEWVTDFRHMDDACDTVNLKFRGTGATGSVGIELSKLNLSASYFSESRLTSKNRLPQRFIGTTIFSPTDRIRIGVGITSWQWRLPFKPMNRVSVGGEVDVKPVTLRAGFYTGNWYYEIYEYGAVKEKVGSVGVGVSLPSLCSIDLSFEFGKRYNSQVVMTTLLEEEVYRICISLQGREVL